MLERRRREQQEVRKKEEERQKERRVSEEKVCAWAEQWRQKEAKAEEEREAVWEEVEKEGKDRSLGGAEARVRREVVVRAQCVCQHQALCRNIEYIASCYHDQRSTQRRTGEWRKVAKVMDRLFMWLFFIMVFLMSLLIMGKAV